MSGLLQEQSHLPSKVLKILIIYYYECKGFLPDLLFTLATLNPSRLVRIRRISVQRLTLHCRVRLTPYPLTSQKSSWRGRLDTENSTGICPRRTTRTNHADSRNEPFSAASALVEGQPKGKVTLIKHTADLCTKSCHYVRA